MISIINFIIFTLLLSCSVVTSKNKPIKLTILHTNDHHGRFWQNQDGEYGLAARATLINRLKKEIKENGGEVLLLDAGDVNTGVPQSDLLDAEPDFRGMAAIGYDAMVIGNHEFDRPLETLLKQQKDWAKFPFISANIYDSQYRRIFPSHILKKIGDLNVVIFGLTTEDTPKKSNPKNSQGLIFKPAVEEAKTFVPMIKAEANLIIAITHMGHYIDEKHGTEAPGDVTLARQVDGIDVIIGGHTQKPLFKPDIQNGTIIVQAYEWGKYLGRIDLEISDRKVELKNYELIPVNLKESSEKITPDKKMEALLRPYFEKSKKMLTAEIGSTDQKFIGRGNDVETSLGNLIAFSYKKKFNADLAIVNSGGIRDSINPGFITVESILKVLPFSNEVVTVKMTGAELSEYIEQALNRYSPGAGGFPQFSGTTIVMDINTQKLKSFHINGKKVLKSKKYIIALPEFMAVGGDKYPNLNFEKHGHIDAEILKEYIQKIKVLRLKDFAPRGNLKFE